ncbi:MAG: hypothetical protein K0S07_328 [Chlamydiales bacterium]|jgi:hypothetical protein|nr:hypothetical protein [Chlamydiales bacterium]
MTLFGRGAAHSRTHLTQGKRPLGSLIFKGSQGHFHARKGMEMASSYQGRFLWPRVEWAGGGSSFPIKFADKRRATSKEADLFTLQEAILDGAIDAGK